MLHSIQWYVQAWAMWLSQYRQLVCSLLCEIPAPMTHTPWWQTLGQLYLHIHRQGLSTLAVLMSAIFVGKLCFV